MIKTTIKKIENDKKYIEEELKINKINLEGENINLNDKMLLFQDFIIIETENLSSGLFNCLRQIGYKDDYQFYLEVSVGDIYFTNIDKNNERNTYSVNTQEIKNKINSIIIDNRNEDELVKHLDKIVGNAVKHLNFFHNPKRDDFLDASDIKFTTDIIKIDRYIKLSITPAAVKDCVLNIKNITLKKDYSYSDLKRSNIELMVMDDNKIDETAEVEEEDNMFNEELKKFDIKIKTIGSLNPEDILPRYANILFIKLNILNYTKIEISDEEYILIKSGGDNIRLLLMEYGHNKKIDIIAKLIKNNNIICFNVTTKECDDIIDNIKKDIISLVSSLKKINIKDAEINLKNNTYAKYYL